MYPNSRTARAELPGLVARAGAEVETSTNETHIRAISDDPEVTMQALIELLAQESTLRSAGRPRRCPDSVEILLLDPIDVHIRVVIQRR